MAKSKAIANDNTAVIYGRFSSDNQREESIDAQVRACREYAKSKDLEIVNIYTDSAKTGTNSNREQFQKMIKDSAKREFRYVIIHKLDRFARNRYDSAVCKRELQMNGVQVLSVIENLTDTAEGKMMEAVLEGMAEYFSANLARETMKGMKENAYKCIHTGGIPPLGYDVDSTTRKLTINEEEANIVKIIFDMYAAG